MSYCLSLNRMDEIFKRLRKEYHIYAPVRFENRGRYSDTDLIGYAEVDSVKEIVYDEKSDLSPKELIYPITQTLFHFTEFEYQESKVADKKMLIFVRPCDINGIKRLDTVFLKNGGEPDIYYQRLREKVKFVLMECKDGWDSCFCVSMGSNQTADYSLAVRFKEDELLLEVKDQLFVDFFAGEEKADFTPEFISANQQIVELPEIESQQLLEKVYQLELWQDYNSRCQSCGACTVACISCSCFTSSDLIYSENGRAGERRRVWASCLHEDFTEMAGGHSFRNTPAERMRFRTLHKVYDYQLRFGGEQMCVGCGRCTDRCPQLISFAATINRLTTAVEKLKDGDRLLAERAQGKKQQSLARGVE